MQALPDNKLLSCKRAGFTLVELLLSTAILGLMMLLIGQLFSSTSQSWVRGEGDAERRRGTRALTDFIGRELQEALLPVEVVKD